MEISKGRMFRTLFLKDLLLAKNESLLILGFIIVGNLFLLYKAQTTWHLEMALGFSWVIFMFIPLSIFFRAFSSISSEWKENTVYLMMSLPVSGPMVLFSKLLSLLTRLILLVIAALPFTAILFFRLPMVQMMELNISLDIITNVFMAFTLMILVYTMFLVTALFSAQVGRLAKKFSGFVTFVTFIITNYVVSKLIEILYRATRVAVIHIDMTEVRVDHIYFSEFAIASSIILLITAALFFITSSIYDKKVEL